MLAPSLTPCQTAQHRMLGDRPLIASSTHARRETHCEFCDRMLPDWKKTLTPTCGANAPAVMNVNFDGRTYSFEVQSGTQ